MSHRQDLAKYMKVDKQHTGSDWFPFGGPRAVSVWDRDWKWEVMTFYLKKKKRICWGICMKEQPISLQFPLSVFLSLFFPKGRCINYHECPVPGTEMNMFIYAQVSTCRYYLCKTLSLAEIRVNQSNGLWFSLKWFKTVRKTSKIWCPGVP